MLKKLMNVVKKLVFSFLVLYGLNLLVNSFNVVIPINIFTVITGSVLGIPGVLSLVIMFFIVK